MDPTSKEATSIIRDKLNLSKVQHDQLIQLSELCYEWNQKINLMSRKQTQSIDVVFGRHVLPSLAPLTFLNNLDDNDNDDVDDTLLLLKSGQRVCDVGTGGGFPGLPLAIARPDVEFVLVDSVGKKITAVQNMADQLGLNNVRTYHGRSEELATTATATAIANNDVRSNKFDFVVGRSVAAIPTYCYWIQDLLKERTGYLVYLIGGDIPQDVLDEVQFDESIETLLDCPNSSDKRVLCFSQESVQRLAATSGEKPRINNNSNSNSSSRQRRRRPASSGNNDRRKRKVKGQWTKRGDTAGTPKQRGYDNFQRFDSLNPQ